ncbi:MAG: glycosyltransferase [Bacteroidetes bacterium]|jgi:rSAM/selenodomain-associated transferase 2|nr:glycosyltransferase [Bacteroidota bacterium]
MSDIFISIIIPTFNEEVILGGLLKHLKKCCPEISHEIIIADGGSDDGTVQIAENFDATVIHCQNKGRAAQMNEGAEHSSGTILYFLHADTLPPQNFSDYISQSFKKGYKSGCFQLVFDDPHPLLTFYGWFTRFRLTLFRFGDQSLFVEKTLFEEVGGFDESMIVMEDQKIVRELKKAGSFQLLDERVTTSARRYKVNGVIRLQAVFFLILLLYYSGVSQSTLVHVYKEFIDN